MRIMEGELAVSRRIRQSRIPIRRSNGGFWAGKHAL